MGSVHRSAVFLPLKKLGKLIIKNQKAIDKRENNRRTESSRKKERKKERRKKTPLQSSPFYEAPFHVTFWEV